VKEPLALVKTSVSRNGTVKVKFNHQIRSPFTKAKERGRQMISEEDINVSRDLLDCTLAKQDENDTPSDFYLELLKWDVDQIVLFLNFTNTHSVSMSIEPDGLFCELRSPHMIVSTETGERLKQEKAFGFT
jgi:hypothetical protein